MFLSLLSSTFTKLKSIRLGWIFLDFYDLNPDPAAMDSRLRKKISPSEFFALLFSMAFVGIFIWLINAGMGYPADLNYCLTGRTSQSFYYGYWILPVFEFLNSLPIILAYSLWCLCNILSVFFAARVFGGKAILVLFSYQMLSLLYYGQISGILAGGLALLWWGLTHRRGYIAGAGLLIALTKYQVGLTLGLLLIWYGFTNWRIFFRLLLVPAIIGFISLFVYPLWPLEVIQKLHGFPYVHLGITFWNHIGAWSLIFWLPALFLPLQKPQRFLALYSLSAFAVPYLGQVDLLSLLAFPIGWVPLFGWLGVLFPLWGMTPVYFVALVPFICYLHALMPSLTGLFKKDKPLLV